MSKFLPELRVDVDDASDEEIAFAEKIIEMLIKEGKIKDSDK